MTALDIITKCDRLKPNVYSQSQKRDWLNNIEAEIMEYMCMYTNQSADMSFENTENPVLSLSDTDANIYIYYIISMIDLANLEYDLYNNSSSFFNSLFNEWKKKHRRQNQPQTNISIRN